MVGVSMYPSALCLALICTVVRGLLLPTGITCYRCESAFSPDTCSEEHPCSSDQLCYTEKLAVPGQTSVYRLGCIPSFTCSNPPNPSNGVLCFSCCSSSKCNKALCINTGSCPPSHYGPGCLETCGECSSNDQCDKETGRCPDGCKSGFVVPFCKTACPIPWYGPGCSHVCGHCLSGDRCDSRSGRCIRGCELGYTPPICSEVATIRLVNGPSPQEGRLEVFHDNVWGTVCDDSFVTKDAQVACRQLGYPSDGSVIFSNAHYGQGSGNIWLDEVACLGNENTLGSCTHSGWGIHDCSHSEDVGIHCTNAIRLVNGGTISEGRVEIQHGGQWGTVCDDNFDVNAAIVVCRSMGYYGTAIFKSTAFFGQGVGQIWLDGFVCSGREDHIANCTMHNVWGTHDCQHSEDVGVICSK